MSGNPGGRPRAVAEVRDLARQQTEAGIRALVGVMQRGKSESARVAAAQALLDRGWGKAVQAVEAAVQIEDDLDLTKLSREELAAYIALLGKARRNPRPAGGRSADEGES